MTGASLRDMPLPDPVFPRACRGDTIRSDNILCVLSQITVDEFLAGGDTVSKASSLFACRSEDMWGPLG